jgi:hypothetical protein
MHVIATCNGLIFQKFQICTFWQDFGWKKSPCCGYNNFRNMFNGILNSIYNMNLELKHLKILPLEYEPKI